MSFRTRFKNSFSHNDFYHPFLLRQVPNGCRRALDVGCGTGDFARLLATRAEQVDAVDRSAEMISAARPAPNVSFVNADIRDLDLTPRYDFISCIATIHHVPFGPAVTQLRDALTPGGVLAILGLSRYTLAHLWIDVIAFAPNKVRQLQAALQAPEPRPRMPMMWPQLSLTEIRAQARTLLPGARIRNHLYWRYSLIYINAGQVP
jgi:SAM-dependent methyltransferase